jgi:hypothetical protein
MKNDQPDKKQAANRSSKKSQKKYRLSDRGHRLALQALKALHDDWLPNGMELIRKALEEDICSDSTLQRFWDRTITIGEICFKGICCKLLEIEDWYTLTEEYESQRLDFSSYRQQEWAGRGADCAELSRWVQEGYRLIMIVGLLGIGKTALAEWLAEHEHGVKRYVRVGFDELAETRGDRSFSRWAYQILKLMGEEIDQTWSASQLLNFLIDKLSKESYWLQLDSAEFLLDQVESGFQFVDSYWVDFFHLFVKNTSASQIVLTSRYPLSDLEIYLYSYPNFWKKKHLSRLLREEWLEILKKYGACPETADHEKQLELMAESCEGHPLMLKIMAGDLKESFRGHIGNYWSWHERRHQLEEYEVDVPDSEESFRRRIIDVIDRLPESSREMLQCTSVLRREVPISFYCKMLDGDIHSEDVCIQAFKDLQTRYLVFNSGWKKSSKLFSQHNLLRQAVCSGLKKDKVIWESYQKKAAVTWQEQCHDNNNDSEYIAGALIESSKHYMKLKDYHSVIELYYQ